MPKFDEFDLDLRQPDSTNGDGSAVSFTANGLSDSDVITSIAKCTRNGQYYSCMCSTCCTSHTVPAGCSNGC